MTLGEFKSWFDGYTLAGGKDIEVIKSKLLEVMEFSIDPNPYVIPYVPYYPWNPPVYPSPTVPSWPQITWTSSGTSNNWCELGNDLQLWYNAGIEAMNVIDKELDA